MMSRLAPKASDFAQRVFPLAVLTLALIAVPVLSFAPTGLPRLAALRSERDELNQEMSRLTQRINQLRAEVRRIKDDPTAVERTARDELGLVRRSEVVFQFGD